MSTLYRVHGPKGVNPPYVSELGGWGWLEDDWQDKYAVLEQVPILAVIPPDWVVDPVARQEIQNRTNDLLTMPGFQVAGQGGCGQPDRTRPAGTGERVTLPRDMVRVLRLACVLGLIALSCGGLTESTSTTDVRLGSTTTTLRPPSTSVGTITTTTTPTVATVTTTTAPTTTTFPRWPGEGLNVGVPTPAEGPVVSVVGVAFDDTLNVRSGPGIDFGVVGELAPTATRITGTGEGWQLPTGALWWEIDAGAVRGWANSSFLSRIGDVGDITDRVNALVDALPPHEDMAGLGFVVAEAFVDPDVGSTVVLVTAPTISDPNTVAYDVIGAADDSIEGTRLYVTGLPSDEGFVLGSVEAAPMCARGVSAGLCV